MQARTSHFRNAEGIRGLACLVVLAGHGFSMFFHSTGPALLGVGRFGVWLFFVLSAFLLTNHLLIGTMTRAKLADYAVGRLLRIMPLYIVAIASYWWLGTAGIDSIGDVSRAVFLTAGYAHLWTIPVEMKFYAALATIILPLAWLYRRGISGALALVAGIGVLAIPLFPPALAHTNIIGLGWYFPCFMAGVALAIVQPAARPARAWVAVLLGALVLLGLALMTNGLRVRLGGPASPLWPFDKFIPISIAWALFVAVNVNQEGWLGRFWHTPALRFSGRWSYPIYLFHWLVIRKASHAFPGSVVAFALSIVAVYLISAAAHRFIERPMMALRPRVTSLLMGRASVA